MLGGALGAGCRYAVSYFFGPLQSGGFPWATFSVNMLGCLLIGILWRWLSTGTEYSWLMPLLIAGFLGGFTTFSAFGLESFNLYNSGAWNTLAIYLILSNILGIAFVFTGNKLGALIGK